MDKIIKFSNCNCEVVQGKFDINNISLTCPAVWHLISSGFCKGIFQLETRLGQDWARKVKPSNIQELAAVISLVRPGALECIGKDTKILMGRFLSNKKNRYHYQSISIEKLYNKFIKFKNCKYCNNKKMQIISLDEKDNKLFRNKIINVIKKEKVKIYKLKIKNSYKQSDNYKYKQKNFNIKATENHKFLTIDGWKELKNIENGEYIAVINKWCYKKYENKKARGYKNFNNIAYYHYKHQCVFCNWQDGSLDVHHIEGNRKTNNNPENLVWLCPNHHRMCNENKITKKEIIQARQKYILPFSKDLKYVQLINKEDCGEEQTYDIQVEGPNNNYIAGDFVVHNSGQADEYVDVKFGRKKLNYLHPCLENILGNTYGCLVYQEQAIKIATEIAGFSLENADELRKAMGKKIPELMSKLKTKFMEGCLKKGFVTKEIAEQIFGWIEKSQRYSFNKSHAVSYAMLGYQSGWIKTHFPNEFFTSYLTFSNYKSDPKQEVYELVQDARLFGIDVLPPDTRMCNVYFKMMENGIRFGLSNIRGVGQSAITKIIEQSQSLSTWNEFLKSLPVLHRSIGVALIKSGACDCYNMERSQMIKELEIIFGTTIRNKDGKNEEIRGLTEKERAWFFNKLIDNRSIKDVLFEMVQQAENSPSKSLSSLKKEDVINWSKKILGEQFDFSGLTKQDVINKLKENNYDESSSKSCVVGKRLQIIKERYQQLLEEQFDTNLGKSTAEKYFLGIALSCSPADDADDSNASHNCLDLMKCLNGESFSVCAVIDSVKHTKTKKGKNPGSPMCFLTISDSSYSVDHAVCFPDAYERLHGLCKDGLVCLLHGHKQNGSIIIENIQKLI